MLLSPHQVGKLFPSRPSFLRRRTSTGFASRRSTRWQSENQKDSRLGRVIISDNDGTCALLNAQQIKMVSREACVCAMCSRTGQDCMCAYVRTFVTGLEVLRAVDQTPALALHLFNFLFVVSVNLFCRKSEIESLGFTCNWLVLVGRLAWTSATCTYFRVADKFTTAKTKGWNALPSPSGYPAFVWLLRWSFPTEGNTSAQNSRVAVNPIKLTTMHKWANPTLICTSCHFYRGDKCDAPCTSKTSSFHSSAAGTWSFGTLVHNNISVVQLKPTKIFWQRLLVPLAFATAKSAFYSVGSPAHPKMLAAVANRWADTESKVSFSSRQTTTGHAFDSRMLKLKMKSRCGRPGRREGARVSAVDWCVSHNIMGNPHSNEIDVHLRY